MSASHYKDLLSRTLIKLSSAQTSASEWMKVANNRLLLLSAIDSALNVQIYHLLKVGTIFGVDPRDPSMPIADFNSHSADEITGFILAKLEAAAEFTANLTREAAALQETLSSTLSIALEAKSVDRPTMDLKIKDYTQLVEGASTPLKAIFEEIEDLPAGATQEDPTFHGTNHPSTTKRQNLDTLYSDTASITDALAIMKRK